MWTDHEFFYGETAKNKKQNRKEKPKNVYILNTKKVEKCQEHNWGLVIEYRRIQLKLNYTCLVSVAPALGLISLVNDVVIRKKYIGQPRWLGGLTLPSVQGVIPETQETVPHLSLSTFYPGTKR